MAKRVAAVVQAVKASFEVAQRVLTDDEYLEACDELVDEFESRSRIKRKEMDEAP